MFLRGLLILLLLSVFSLSYAAPKKVMVLPLAGAIGPVSQGMIIKAIASAQAQQAEALVLELDTPGGLVKSTRVIVQAILKSTVPVITYVSPSGARAASAGTYLLYASSVAAMAPGTNLGAATPVSLGGGKQSDSKVNTKVINDASAYLQSLAELHGRNVDWAKQAVLKGESLSAEQALKANVIDVTAKDLPTLLTKINGMTVKTAVGMKTLTTKNVEIEKIKLSWREKLLAVITDPAVAYVLLLVGIYGLILEFSTPGFVAPGIVGAISLLLALYALQLLPISYVGVGLLLLGVSLMTAEALAPSIGVLGFGGVVAFAAGSVLFFEKDFMLGVAWPIITAVTLISVAFFTMVFQLTLRSRRQPVVSGAEYMVGRFAVAEQGMNEQFFIRLEGDRWQIKSEVSLHLGQQVEVVAVDGVFLIVRPQGH